MKELELCIYEIQGEIQRIKERVFICSRKKKEWNGGHLLFLLFRGRSISSTGSLYISILVKDSAHKYKWSTTIYIIYLIIYVLNKEGGFSMRDIKTYLSVAPVLTTLWFGSLAGLLIEINRLFPDALTFPFFSF